MLKVAYNLGVRQAFLDAGIIKESMSPWVKRPLMGAGVGAGLGAGTAALLGGDLSDVGIGAGIGALGGGLTGGAISGIKRLELQKFLDKKRAAMDALKAEFEEALAAAT
jgi:hypothetical protein